jgi:enamidase
LLAARSFHNAREIGFTLIDAPDGSTQSSALAAIKHGDIAAIGAVISDGVPRFVGRSRNTPPTTRRARVTRSRVIQNFAGVAH